MFNGFLEKDLNGFNRYISGRGVEWKNNRSILISISEIVIYSGFNRQFDIAYLNPFITHLEVELNEKDNDNLISNDNRWNNANGVWQLSTDYKINKKMRLSFNFLVDEFVIDKIERNNHKADGLAFSSKINHFKETSIGNYVSQSISYVYVGTHTFRHGSGSNNFIIRSKPLGWINGSDGHEFMYTFQAFLKSSNFFSLHLGYRESGQESIISRPYDSYENYLKGPFPSGEIEKIFFIEGGYEWWTNKNVCLKAGFQIDGSRLRSSNFNCQLGVHVLLESLRIVQ